MPRAKDYLHPFTCAARSKCDFKIYKKALAKKRNKISIKRSVCTPTHLPHVGEFVGLFLLGRAEPERLKELVALLPAGGVGATATAAAAAKPRSGRQPVQASERRDRCRGQLCRPIRSEKHRQRQQPPVGRSAS